MYNEGDGTPWSSVNTVKQFTEQPRKPFNCIMGTAVSTATPPLETDFSFNPTLHRRFFLNTSEHYYHFDLSFCYFLPI